MLWIYKTLEEHTLSQKLLCLISDYNHLSSCYNENAFLRQLKFSEATILCLKAVEQNQPSFLTEINPNLVSSNFFFKDDSAQVGNWTLPKGNFDLFNNLTRRFSENRRVISKYL